MASGSLSLDGIRAACDGLGGIARSLAEEGSVALIVGSDGNLSFTSLGTRAISEARHPHPLQRMIATACEAHHARTGSDCKVLLTLLDETLRLSAGLARELGDNYARRVLLTELSHFDSLLPELFRAVRESVGTVSDPADPAVFDERLADVVGTRSGTSRETVSEFVRRSVPDRSASLDALDYFVDRFEDVCSRAVTAADESVVLKGFLLSSDCPRSAADLRFVVVWDVSVKTDDVVWAGDAVSLSRIWPRIEATLNRFGDRGISLILTPSAAPSRLHACCSRVGVSLVDRISPGDLQNVLFFTGVVPLDTLNDPVEADSVSRIDSMRPVVFGGSRFLHLETSVTGRPFLPHHVVLCAPSPAAWKERYSEFHDCLKVLRQWLRPSGLQRSDPADSLSDLSLAQRSKESPSDVSLAQRSKESPSDLSLAQRSKESPSDLSLAQRSKQSPSDLSNPPPFRVFGLSVPLSLWELELKLALPRAERSCPNLYRLLDSALLAVACGTWGIPVCRYRGRDSYEEYARRNGAKGFDPFVPAATAESLLMEMLQLLRQLLRIDAVVGSKDALRGLNLPK